MYLLHHSFTGTFSGVLVDPHAQLLCIQQPSNGIHTTVGEALGKEVVKDQGNLVVLDHLWSLYELFRCGFALPLGGAEATRLYSQGPFEHVHCLIRLYCLLGGKHLSTIYTPLIPVFSTTGRFPLCCRLLSFCLIPPFRSSPRLFGRTVYSGKAS
jgi:hypothetical protein